MRPVLGQGISESICPDDNHMNFHSCALEALVEFDPPRTAWGAPNLQGIWSRRARAHESLHAHPQTRDDNEAPSIVVSPIDGLVPIQPWAEAKRRYNRPAYVHQNAICRLSGVPVTIRSVIQDVVKLVGGGEPQYGAILYKPLENMALYADIQKAKKLLNWNPITELDEGLNKTIEYYKNL